MRHLLCAATIAVLSLGFARSGLAQSALFDFEDGTDQGWGTGFGDDTTASFTITNIGGSNRMFVPHTAFQSAGIGTGNTSTPFFQAMAAAAVDETQYQVSYDWYVDTSAGGYGNFLQAGTFVNSGSGAYNQDFPASNKEVELNGAQLGTPAVYSGHVSVNMAAAGLVLPAGETFYRFGIILNGDGASAGVYYDNISIAPIVATQVPEPATLGLLALPATALLARRRRRA